MTERLVAMFIIGAGVQLVATTSDAFDAVSVNSEKVGNLIGAIAAASDDQAQGIEQVNSAVSEMNHVTQQNAAISEESASASTEIHSEIVNIRATIREVAELVDGAESSGRKAGGGPQTVPNHKKTGHLPATTTI